METKEKIIVSGIREKMVDIPCSYSVTHSNIGKILENKDKIMEPVKSAVPLISIKMAKKCGKMMENMEKLLKVCGYRISISVESHSA